MKLVHFESGLGNQMLNYAEYLAIKQANPDDSCYIENIIYEISEAHKVICQWNGYELDKIFNLHLPNIFDEITENQKEKILNFIRESKFWENKWNYPDAILGGLKLVGLNFENLCIPRVPLEMNKLRSLLFHFTNETLVGANIKLFIQKSNPKKYGYSKAKPEKLFVNSKKNLYLGQTGLFMHKGNHIEDIENELYKAFRFPSYELQKDIELAHYIKQRNSISIHARRGDAIAQAGRYYKTGYYSRSVKFIKKQLTKPLFVFFSEPGSIEWCMNNLDVFNLSKNDEIIFVDWHANKDNFRDLQLMSDCKNNIVTYSSFSWWASFLNQNQEKITISPMFSMNTTHHF